MGVDVERVLYGIDTWRSLAPVAGCQTVPTPLTPGVQQGASLVWLILSVFERLLAHVCLLSSTVQELLLDMDPSVSQRDLRKPEVVSALNLSDPQYRDLKVTLLKAVYEELF